MSPSSPSGRLPSVLFGNAPDPREKLGLTEKTNHSSSEGSSDNKNKSSSSDKGTPTFREAERTQQQQMDYEDKRLSDVSEGILYNFLPSAFNAVLPPCEDPREELTRERCKWVASAAVCMGALMSVPPPFLEFLICIPWEKAGTKSSTMEGREWIRQHLQRPDPFRNELVNTPIQPCLIPTVLEFLFSDVYHESLPPSLKSPTESVSQTHLETVGALLEGATPLHCAALRGNPAQVDHLLSCGADPTIKTAAGDLALQWVPFCGERHPSLNRRCCYCMDTQNQEIWECRSSTARALIVRKCVFRFDLGIVAWLGLMLFCLLNALGLWGCSTEICKRNVLSRYVERQKMSKLTKAHLEAKKLLNASRMEARQGQRYLDSARNLHPVYLDCKTKDLYLSHIEKAVQSYTQSVHFLRHLLMHNDGQDLETLPQAAPRLLPKVTASDCQMEEEEQAELYTAFGECHLLKFQACRCPGCAALATHAIRMAHCRVAELLQISERSPSKSVETQFNLGCHLKQLVYFHICLLLDTETRQSPTKASTLRADQCLREWKRLEEREFIFDDCDHQMVRALEQKVMTAEADLTLAEALYQDVLKPNQSINEVLKMVVTQNSKVLQCFLITMTPEIVESLETALNRAQASSPELVSLTVEVMQNCKRELRASAKLKKCLALKTTSAATTETLQMLSDAVQEAEIFPRLAVDVVNARQLHQQLVKRAEAIERLEVIMLQVNQPNEIGRDPTAELSTIQNRISILEAGIESARQSRINIEKAKKLLRELHGQAAVMEAAFQLDAVMDKKPCGTAILKTALSKAENCCTSSSTFSSGSKLSSDFLLPRIQAARRRLDVERAVESLNRATANSSTVDDLPKLESIILDARKVFDEHSDEELDPSAYRAARALRGTLHHAAQIRQQLQSNIKALQKSQKETDALTLEKLIFDAQSCEHLSENDTNKARQVLENWKRIREMETRLENALREVETAFELSKAIHEAAAVGVKTSIARKVLKWMQSLEKSMQHVSTSQAQCSRLKSVIDDAERGGVSPKLISKARSLLLDTLATRSQATLDAALKADSGRSLEKRSAQLKEAMESARNTMAMIFNPVSTEKDIHPSSWELFDRERMDLITEVTESLRNAQSAFEEVQRVFVKCQTELSDQKIEEEEAKRMKDQKMDQERKIAIQKTEDEAKATQKTYENALNTRFDVLAVPAESVLSGTVEKSLMERRLGQFRRPLVDPSTQQTVTLSSSAAPYIPMQDRSFSTIEISVQRLLDEPDEMPMPEIPILRPFVPPIDGDRVKGMLEKMDDPWGIASDQNFQNESPFLAPEPSTDSFTKRRLKESMVYRLEGHPLSPARDPIVHEGLNGSSFPLDSSAPAFYPLSATERIEFGKGVPRFTPTLISPLPSGLSQGSLPLQRAESSDFHLGRDYSRSRASPFPGVGAGIPGATSRSLSARSERLRQYSITGNEDLFPMPSSEF